MATTNNSSGNGTSMAPVHQNNNQNPQIVRSQGHLQQGVAQVQLPRSQGVRDGINEHNSKMNASDLQRQMVTFNQATTLASNIQPSQVLSSRSLEAQRLLGSQGVPNGINGHNSKMNASDLQQQTIFNQATTLASNIQPSQVLSSRSLEAQRLLGSQGVPDGINGHNSKMNASDLQQQTTFNQATTLASNIQPSQVLSSRSLEAQRLLGSQGVPNGINGHNSKMNASDLQQQMVTFNQATTLSSNIQPSQVLSSRSLEAQFLLGNIRAFEKQKLQMDIVSTNGVTQCDKGKPREPLFSHSSLQEFTSTLSSFLGTTTIEGSQVLSSRNSEIALRHIGANERREHQMSLVSTNGVPIGCGKTIILGPSSTRVQPSVEIHQMSSTRRGRARKTPSEELMKNLEKYQPLRSGRPRKRRAEGESTPNGGKEKCQPQPRGQPRKQRKKGESSSNSEKFQRSDLETGTIGMATKLQEAHKTPKNVENEDQRANLANPSSAPRQYVNAVYDPKYQKDGVFIDPHLRLFHALTGK